MRQRLAALATFATRFPRVAIALVVSVAVAMGAVAVFGPLSVSTSRTGLVSEDDPGQARLLDFFDRFGRPEAAVFVISGGDADGRRAVAGELIRRLPELPQLEGRVLGKLNLRLLAEVLVVNHPPLLDGFGAMAGGDDHPVGLEGMVRALETRILANLDDGDDEGEAAPGTAASVAKGEHDLARLVPLVQAFDAALRGDGSSGALLGLAEGNGLATHQALDDQGFLVGGAGDHHLVVTFPAVDTDEGNELSPLVDRMRQVRDEVIAEVAAPGVRAELTGLPALATDELRVVGRGIQVTSLLSALGILLLLMFAFRSLRKTIVVLVPLAFGVVATLGIVELLYGGLNLITANFVPVLMGLGVDIGVHLLYRYGEDRRRGVEDRAAMRSALVHAGPGVATGTATTAMAFLTVATTEFTAFSELGIITAIGLVVMLLSAFLLVPPLMRLGRGAPSTPPEFPGATMSIWLVSRWPMGVLLGAAVITVAAVAAFVPSGPGFNGRYFDFLPKDTESYAALVALEQDRVMGPAVVNLSADSFEEVRELVATLDASAEIGAVHSPTHLMPPLDDARLRALRAGLAKLAPNAVERLVPPVKAPDPEQLAGAVTALQDAFDEVAFALEQVDRDTKVAREAAAALAALARTLMTLDDAGRATLWQLERDAVDVARRAVGTARDVAQRGAYLPSDLPPLFRIRYMSKDGTQLAIFAYPSGDLWEPTFGSRFTAAVERIQPSASGLGLDVQRHEEMITSGFVKAALYSMLMVALLLLLVFRKVGDALLAMLPVLVGWIWMLGAMKPLGLSFDIANLVALPLILGIGLDAGAHMIHRYRESLAEGGTHARLSDLVRGTGAAVVVSFLTTIVGFAALIASDYGGMRSLGLLLVVGLGLCLLASTLVLPAVLVLLGRAK